MGPSDATAVAASPAQAAYFRRLLADAERVLAIARTARAKGLDPSLDVEIPLAADLAARVQEQVQIPGLAERIRELTKQHGQRELVALHCAKEVAQGRFQAWPGPEAALDKAVRTGLSILTEGVLVAPLEGIAKVELGSNPDGTNYVDLYFAGPIRSAGGTAQAMSVLIADVVRRDLGIGRFQATQPEVERYKEEVPAYKRAQHLQYAPEPPEIEALVRHCPVCINGEGTEEAEVQGHRDLPRVETNRLRGGAVLVLAEGLAQKAAKIVKIVDKLELQGWDFLKAFVKKPAEGPQPGPDELAEIEESDKFIKELIAGRPVLAHPSRVGGFRLRYGRGRTCGLASTAVSPLTMHAVDDFLATGTQMKIERPGKGTIATPCDELEGPILLLRGGDLVQPASVEEFQRVKGRVETITDLGEILIPFGEFFENNALLPDASFTVEWWLRELEAVASPAAAAWKGRAAPDFEEALALSRAHAVPLHPAHNFFWHDLAWDGFRALSNAAATAHVDGAALALPASPEAKRALIDLGALHEETPDGYRVRDRWQALAAGLGFAITDGSLREAPNRAEVLSAPPSARFPVLEAASRLTGVPIKPRAPTRVGARMGRPEKADRRAMDPPVHVLFPVGQEGGIQRSLEDAAEKIKAHVKVGPRRCAACGAPGFLVRCDQCGKRTEPTGQGPQERDIPVKQLYAAALGRLGIAKPPKKIKGVQGLVSEAKLPEPLEKGILRALHEVSVFKDGTLRFDATDAPLTHFRPAEIGTGVGTLRDLGYETDVTGAPLERADQVLELRVQDVVLPVRAGEYFVQCARYVDDLLERFYGLAPFYNVQRPADLVGHLVAGLAPHTSGAVLGRIIGYTKAQVGYAHPFYHAGKRRNCLEGSTEVHALNSPLPVRTKLESLYRSVLSPATRVDDVGALRKDVKGLSVLSVEPESGRVEPRPVNAVYRIPAPATLLQVTTASGRSLVCSPRHRLMVLDESGALSENAAMSLKVGQQIGLGLPGPDSGLRSSRDPVYGDIFGDPIIGIEHRTSSGKWLYDLEVEGNHTYLVNDSLVTHNCDGDEDAFMLLLDAFLNFSRTFIPDRRGGLMDLPLVLATQIDPNEIDKEAHNLDVGWSYPLEFYRATERHLPAKDVASRIDLVAHRLGTPRQYEGFGFGLDTRSINAGPVESAYKTLGSMPEKMAAQLALADKLRGVDAADVAARVISHHLLPDLIGNLKAYAKQSVRCTKCNAKYRRMPVAGRCTRLQPKTREVCGNTLQLTVHEASVRKYLDVCLQLMQKYEIPEYTRQHIRLAQKFIDDTFRVRDLKLAAFG